MYRLRPEAAPDEQPDSAPHAAQERREDEVGGIDEVHLPAAPTGLSQPRLQLLLQEDRLLPSVFLDRLLGWDRDGPGLAPAEAELILEEVTHLGQAPPDAGLLLDDRAGLLHRAGWMLLKVLLQ